MVLNLDWLYKVISFDIELNKNFLINRHLSRNLVKWNGIAVCENVGKQSLLVYIEKLVLFNLLKYQLLRTDRQRENSIHGASPLVLS